MSPALAIVREPDLLPGAELIVREDMRVPSGVVGKWTKLQAGERVILDRITDRGRLLLRGHWFDFPPEAFDRA